MASPSDSAGSPGQDKRLRAYLRPYKGRLAFGVLLLLLTNAFDKAIPWVLQNAIDALEGERFGDVRSAALTVMAIAAGLWIFRTRSRIQVFNVGRDVEYDLRNELIDNVHRLGPTFFRKMATGEVMSRATSDLGQVRLLVGFGVLQVVDSIFAFGGAIALMLALSPELTLYAMAPFPMIIFLARFFGKRLYARSREHQEALAKLADVAQENLAGVRVVRAYAIEDAEQRRFDVANQAAVDASMRLVVLRGFMWPLLLLVASVGTLIVIWQGGQMVLDDRLSVGELAAFNAYLAQLVWPTLALGWLLSVVQRGRAGYDRVRTILDAEPEVFSDGELEPTGPGAMEVAGLEYTVHEDGEAVPILRGVDLAVPAKGSLAIMGTVGSGKSTLAALLPRLAPTPRGAVFLDGRDVTDVELRALRKAVGYAQQEPFLFSTTVERNIAFGMEDPDAPGARGRIEAAAEEACILDEIATLPDGMETLVGERGVQLSGGQKQRIALARALLNEPQVIVLDDPMSAVDARTEAQILRALDRAGEGRTLILVTHRVAAASRCERIVVLDEGRIVERGTHAELVAAGGRYAALAERQQLEEELQRASEPPQPPEAAS